MPPKTAGADRLNSRLIAVDGCRVFTGWRDKDGYGWLRVNGKKVGAHRVAWELENGPIPTGLSVLHRCDNPPCCDVGHLFIGTQADNVADREAKGRTKLPSNSGEYQRAKTHCPQGHPYSGDNLLVQSDGWRRCRACTRR